MSESEPELGLGILTSYDHKTLTILFERAETSRIYGIKGAPIKRVIFIAGDEITLKNGEKKTVEEAREDAGIYSYRSGAEWIIESELSSLLNINRPEDRLFSKGPDSPTLFDLRFRTLTYKKEQEENPLRGFLGGRMNLIPHQFYVAKEMSKQTYPRFLLADEVGLGKTVEAGLLLHHLILTERAKRVLILVPDSLVYQWFIELRRKFNLNFTTLNQETYLEPETNPFLQNDKVIVNIGLFKGSEMACRLMNDARWDMMVIDEAHQLKWEENKISPEYKIAERIARNSKGLLLLTATPEQLGPAGHFARLKLLDPDRFFDYAQFLEQSRHFDEVAKSARKLLEEKPPQYLEKINELKDLHGPGRVFFRNTRIGLNKNLTFFPKRILHSYPLESEKTKFLSFEEEEKEGAGFDLKYEWLLSFLEHHREEKILLLTHSKTKVISLEKLLKENMPRLKVAAFHSGLSFLARDRQAQYFAEKDGAQILLCTEIGSEGRNFEFSHHLVLFDLPPGPDRLEQRIGRLDRIGQSTDIHIHVPFLLSSFEEILLGFHYEGLNTFCGENKGANFVFEELQTLLEEYLKRPSACLQNANVFRDFILTAKSASKTVSDRLEAGRDILVELNSFNEAIAKEIVSGIERFDNSAHLNSYLNDVFAELGVDIEDLDDNIYYIKPSDNMYVPYFPCLSSDGMRITFDRKTAIKRDDVEFITWDHPMTVGVMELILGSSMGNLAILKRKVSSSANNRPNKTFVEAFFRLDAQGPSFLSPKRFFPTSLIRILIDTQKEDFTAKFSKDDIDPKLEGADAELIKKSKSIPRAALQAILKEAQILATSEGHHFKESYLKAMHSTLDAEKLRLLKLKKNNPLVEDREIEALISEIRELEIAYKEAEVVLDSLRIIF